MTILQHASAQKTSNASLRLDAVSVQQHGTGITQLQLSNANIKLGSYLSGFEPLITKVVVLHVCSARRHLQSGVLSLVRLLHECFHSKHLAPQKEAEGTCIPCEHAPGCASNAMP